MQPCNVTYLLGPPTTLFSRAYLKVRTRTTLPYHIMNSGQLSFCTILYYQTQFDLVAVNELSYQQLFADNSSTLPLRVTLFGLIYTVYTSVYYVYIFVQVMSEVKETKLWTSGLLKSVNVSSLSDLSPQSFVKCKSMTRVVMANRLCEALKLIDGCQKKILDLEDSYDQLDEASLVACDENVKLVKQFFFKQF